MGKTRWTTEAQRTWLEPLIPSFIDAQKHKTIGPFFDDVYKKWHDKWPTLPPTEKEIREAEGSVERAQAIKQKAAENVRDH
jgi:hypothetical protein